MRSQAEIIAAAHAGEAGHLIFAFVSAGKDERTEQMNDTLRRLPLERLAVRLLLNLADANGQPVPPAAEARFRTFGIAEAVRVGEFHLAISQVQ